MMETLIKTRFRYIDQTEDAIYVGDAEIDDGAVTILNAWRFGTTIEEVYPYDKHFPITIRRMLEITAREQATYPPATPIELPTDWDEIVLLDSESTYTIAASSIVLPDINSDNDAKWHGLSAVSRIITVGGAYRVTSKGGSFDDVRRELYRIKLF